MRVSKWYEQLSRRGSKSPMRRTQQRAFGRRLAVEPLENRMMLDGTTWTHYEVYAEIEYPLQIDADLTDSIASLSEESGHATGFALQNFSYSSAASAGDTIYRAFGAADSYSEVTVEEPTRMVIRSKIVGSPADYELFDGFGTTFFSLSRPGTSFSYEFVATADTAAHDNWWFVSHDPEGLIWTTGIHGPIIEQSVYGIEVQDGDQLRFSTSAGTLGLGSATAQLDGFILPTSVPNDPMDVTPPAVTNVLISSSENSDPLYSFANHDGSGEQLSPVPVRAADRITITFDEPIVASQSDLTLTGNVVAPAIQSFTLNGNSATWTFADAFDPGDYTLTLSDLVCDYNLNWLDGEWENPSGPTDTSSDTFPSGESHAGGDFKFDFVIGSPFVVSTEVDELDTDYSVGDLSLREALYIAANTAGVDNIMFADGINNIALTSGQLSVDSDVNIIGPGVDTLTINAQGLSRAVEVAFGSTATISGLTVTGGYADRGAGVNAVGTTTLDSVRVTGNDATIEGGGVYAYGNTVIKSSRLDDNSAVVSGGGLYVNATGVTTVTDTSIDGGNEALYGAGIYGLLGGSGVALTVKNSTIADNTAVGTWSFGGGMLLRAYTSGAMAFIGNSTISGNTAAYNGGIRAQDGVGVILANDTIAFNQGNGGSGLEATTGTNVALLNTIVSENTGASNFNTNGTFNSGSRNNLIGVGNNSNISNGTLNNIVLTAGTAGLAALADNGGPTKTHALLSSSAAIDAGWDSIASAYDLAFDQRGEGFDRILDGGIDGDIDIGAFEYV